MTEEEKNLIRNNSKKRQDFIYFSQFHNIAPPHDAETCEHCKFYRELTKR